MTHWLKMEPKQSSLFFKAYMSLSIIEQEVEHVIGTLDGEAIVAWQTCESKSFSKEVFSFEIISNSFEIEAFFFSSNNCSLLKQNQVLKIKPHFSSKHHYNHLYFSKFCFHLGQGQVGISRSPFHLKSHLCLLYTSPSPRDRQKSRMP